MPHGLRLAASVLLLLVSVMSALPPPAAHATNANAASYADLVAAIDTANSSADSSNTINITSNIQLTGDLPDAMATMSFVGNGHTIDGNGHPCLSNGNALGASTGTVTISNLIIKNCRTTGSGGGLFNRGTTIVNNTTFVANSSDVSGGAIDNYFQATMTLTNVTITGNTTVQNGGGIENGGTLTATNVTVYNNFASGPGSNLGNGGTLHLKNSIVASTQGRINYSGASGVSIDDQGGNIQYPGTEMGAGILRTDPKMDSAGLKNNGGLTTTIALQASSPAIDHGVSAGAPSVDQRGRVRPSGGGVDSGAYEFQVVAAPNAPDLQNASDSGSSASDNSTRITNPAFDIGGVVVGDSVELLRDGAVVATLANATATTVSLTDPGPVADGNRVYTARRTPVNSDLSPASLGLTVTIDTTAAAPGTPDLQVASDSGTSNSDNKTNVTNPTFDLGGIETGASVQLLRNGTSVNSLTNAGASTVSLQDPGPVAPNTYIYTATQTDVAGNTSVASGGLSVTVDTSAAAPSTPDLQSASDSGSSNTDNKTNVTNPTFDIGGVEVGASVQLLRDGSPVASLTNAGARSVSIQDPGVPSANTYTYTAIQTVTTHLRPPTIGVAR